MTSESLALAIVTAGTGAAAVVDCRTRRVPNALTASLAATGILIAAAGLGAVSVTAALAGALLGLILMLPGYLFGGTGGGDVKLLAAVGTLLGPSATFAAFLFTTIAGGVIAIAVAISRRRLRHTIGAAVRLVGTGGATADEITSAVANNRFSYAPAIAVGAVLAMVSL
jgi:prepilin peptidase CpaA